MNRNLDQGFDDFERGDGLNRLGKPVEPLRQQFLRSLAKQGRPVLKVVQGGVR